MTKTVGVLGPLDHAADVAGHGLNEILALEGVEHLRVEPRQLAMVHRGGHRAHAQVAGGFLQLDVAAAVEHPAQDRIGHHLRGDRLTRLDFGAGRVRPGVLTGLGLLVGLLGDTGQLLHVVLDE